MAKLTDDLKDKILSHFHIGKSQNWLAQNYSLSVATINKLCKGLTPKYKDKVNTISTIKSELSRESENLVNAFDKEVNDKTKHLIYFQNSALENQRVANEMLKSVDKMQDVESHSRLTSKNKETVLGKEIDTVINNSNNQQNIDNTIEVKFTKI